MFKFTPGGWNRNIPPASKYNVIFAGRNTHVAQLSTRGLTSEEVEANANLIAAAPDLVEALKCLFDNVVACSPVEDVAGSLNHSLMMARFALEKVRGEGNV